MLTVTQSQEIFFPLRMEDLKIVKKEFLSENYEKFTNLIEILNEPDSYQFVKQCPKMCYKIAKMIARAFELIYDNESKLFSSDKLWNANHIFQITSVYVSEKNLKEKNNVILKNSELKLEVDKINLSIFSNVFSKMIAIHDKNEEKSDKLVIDFEKSHLSSEALKAFHSYLTTGEFNSNCLNTTLELYKVADCYINDHLIKKVVNKLKAMANSFSIKDLNLILDVVNIDKFIDLRMVILERLEKISESCTTSDNCICLRFIHIENFLSDNQESSVINKLLKGIFISDREDLLRASFLTISSPKFLNLIREVHINWNLEISEEEVTKLLASFPTTVELFTLKMKSGPRLTLPKHIKCLAVDVGILDRNRTYFYTQNTNNSDPICRTIRNWGGFITELSEILIKENYHEGFLHRSRDCLG